MLLILIIYIFVFCIYFACPLPLRLLIIAINFFLPDPIPILDEVIMGAGIISKLLFLDKLEYALSTFIKFVQEHKKGVLKAILVFIAISYIIYYFTPKG